MGYRDLADDRSEGRPTQSSEIIHPPQGALVGRDGQSRWVPRVNLVGTGVKLIDLDSSFIRREIRPCAGYGVNPECSTVSPPHIEHEWYLPCSFEEADGIQFLCPKCLAAQPDGVGVHSCICWRPRVPIDVPPKPGRWEFTGTGLGDLSLVAGSSSVQLTGGCNAHFFVECGTVRMC